MAMMIVEPSQEYGVDSCSRRLSCVYVRMYVYYFRDWRRPKTKGDVTFTVVSYITQITA